MNILEKLGIKCPVDEIKNDRDIINFHDFIVPKGVITNKTLMEALLKQRKEWELMLEELITDLLQICEICELNSVPFPPCKAHTPPLCDQYENRIKIIESITSKPLEDIKKIIDSK